MGIRNYLGGLAVAGAIALSAGVARGDYFTNVSDRLSETNNYPDSRWGSVTNPTFFDSSWSSFPSGEVVSVVSDKNSDPEHDSYKVVFSNCPVGQTVNFINSFWTSNLPDEEMSYPQIVGYKAYNSKTKTEVSVYAYGENNTSNPVSHVFTSDGKQDTTLCCDLPHWNLASGFDSHPYDYHVTPNGTNILQYIPEPATEGLAALVLGGVALARRRKSSIEAEFEAQQNDPRFR